MGNKMGQYVDPFSPIFPIRLSQYFNQLKGSDGKMGKKQCLQFMKDLQRSSTVQYSQKVALNVFREIDSTGEGLDSFQFEKFVTYTINQSSNSFILLFPFLSNDVKIKKSLFFHVHFVGHNANGRRKTEANPLSETFNFGVVVFEKEGGRAIQPQDVNYVGDATNEDGTLVLTKAKTFTRGSVWLKEQVCIENGFCTSFKFKIDRSHGADGFAFVMQKDSEKALGAHGGGLGYSGLFQCLAIEFDTF